MSFRKLIFGISLVSRVLHFSRVYFARTFDSRRKSGTTCGLFRKTIIYCLNTENKTSINGHWGLREKSVMVSSRGGDSNLVISHPFSTEDTKIL